MAHIQTRKVIPDVSFSHVAVPSSTSFAEKSSQPYRIGLKNQPFKSTLVFDLVDSITIGRESSSSDTVPHIDLQPYNALELGVSRRHAVLKREADRIYLIDNKSVNGVFLNEEALRRETPYPISDGDIIKLGLLSLQVIFFVNPYLA